MQSTSSWCSGSDSANLLLAESWLFTCIGLVNEPGLYVTRQQRNNLHCLYCANCLLLLHVCRHFFMSRLASLPPQVASETAEGAIEKGKSLVLLSMKKQAWNTNVRAQQCWRNKKRYHCSQLSMQTKNMNCRRGGELFQSSPGLKYKHRIASPKTIALRNFAAGVWMHWRYIQQMWSHLVIQSCGKGSDFLEKGTHLARHHMLQNTKMTKHNVAGRLLELHFRDSPT